jgi:hypothetical protein
MDLRRRFVFRGNAAAIGGRIVRPSDIVLESSTASSLTVAGGRSLARSAGQQFGEFIKLGAAATLAEGLFDDLKQEIELTLGRVPEDSLTTSTHVRAEVSDLQVGVKPRLTVSRLRASLSSKSPAGSGEPSIAVDGETAIEGAAIGDCPLILDLNLLPFQKHDTRSKLLAAADDPEFVREFGDCLFMKSGVAGAPAPPTGRLIQGGGTTYATVIGSIKWAGDPYPGAKIDQNMIVVPDYGRIFFGELLITDLSRRLTLLRFELGSPDGGFVACAEVESNGSWST